MVRSIIFDLIDIMKNLFLICDKWIPSSIKGLIGKFLDEAMELANKAPNEQSLDKLGKKIDEFEATTKTAAMDMRSIYGHLYSRVYYERAVQELNEIIDGKTIPEIKNEFVHKKK